MAVFKFENLAFSEEKGQEGKKGNEGQKSETSEEGRVKVVFLRLYYFYLSKKDLSDIGSFKVSEHSIEFDCSEKKAQRFNHLLAAGFTSLKCSLSGLKTVYLHRNSGIPLIGEGVFGLIDRNTNCIEVKPLTCCNLDCMFCSVDAGKSSKKKTEYIIEAEYLVQEFNKIASKKINPLEVHIGPQGEPLLYASLVELIRELRKNPKVKVVSLDTNGTLLTKKLIDELAEAGLTRLNISLQSLDEKRCSMLAGIPYNLKHVLEMIDYAKDKMAVLLAPVIVPGHNDEDLAPLIELGKKISPHSKYSYPSLGIQNYLNYKRGRNPVEQRSWKEFFEMLSAAEKKHGARLLLSKDDFGIMPDTKLEKPFQKKDVVKATVVCDGPELGEKIAECNWRAIIVEHAEKAEIGSRIKVMIIRDKHNIFRGVMR